MIYTIKNYSKYRFRMREITDSSVTSICTISVDLSSDSHNIYYKSTSVWSVWFKKFNVPRVDASFFDVRKLETLNCVRRKRIFRHGG